MTLREQRYWKACEVIRASLTRGETYTMAYTRAGIGETTFYRWRDEREEFRQMLREAEENYISEKVNTLQQSLYKRATGYEYTEVRTEYGMDDDGQPIILRQVKTDRQTAPDTGALVFALCNLAPEKWQNKQRTELTTDDTQSGIRVEVVTAGNAPTKANAPIEAVKGTEQTEELITKK